MVVVVGASVVVVVGGRVLVVVGGSVVVGATVVVVTRSTSATCCDPEQAVATRTRLNASVFSGIPLNDVLLILRSRSCLPEYIFRPSDTRFVPEGSVPLLR